MRPIKIFTIGLLILLLAAGCADVPAPSANLEPSLGEAKIFDYHGVRINYYEAGQGPPVILLHGVRGLRLFLAVSGPGPGRRSPGFDD